MKKAAPLLLALLLLTLQAVGQQKQLPDETLLIALKDGSVIYPDIIQPRALPLLRPYLRVNNQYKLAPDEVKFYKDGSIYYHWAEVNESGEGELLRLAAEGKVTTYFSNTATPKKADANGKPAQPEKPGFFQVGNGPIRTINLDNLQRTLAGNKASMQKLQEAQKLKKTNKICLIAGSSMAAAGIVHSIILNNSSNPPIIETGLKTRVSPLLLLGALTLTVPLANRVPAERKLEEAIALYNK